MSVLQLVSHLQECRRRLSDHSARSNYVALTCAILRLEGAGGMVLYDQPFSRILAGRAFYDLQTVSNGETFAIAFYPLADGIPADRLPVAVASVDAITGEICRLLRELPEPVRENLRLPNSENWWRIVFHFAWHFPRPFLNATRRRWMARNGTPAGVGDETFIQLHGMGGQSDLLPGLIYSELAHDLCTCSEAAVSVILDALQRHEQVAGRAGIETPTLSAEQRRAFDGLRAEFETRTRMQMGLECKLFKLADSFESPPASEWGGLRVGGCVERFLFLSKLNDQQEIVQIRGPATEWFCRISEQAGNVLPPWVPDQPILFSFPGRVGAPRPAMNRDACERWLGFVFATIKQHAPESLCVTWGTQMGPMSYGFATLDRELCAASVMAIDLARLTTTALETAERERATCSPFAVQSMEELGFQWAEDVPAHSPTPPDKYTLGQLVEALRRFGEDYHRTADQIREENPITAKHPQIQLGAYVSGARAFLLAIPGFAELREWLRSEWGEQICFAVAHRIVDTLVERSCGRLSPHAAEGLTFPETLLQLSAPPGEILIERLLPQPRDPAPKRSTERGEGRAKLIAALSKHHEYADRGCLKLEPIGNNELARLAGVAKRTASAFFDKEFRGHAKYKALCGDAGRLAAALKLLNGEYAPHLLYGSKPPEKSDSEDDSADE